MTTAAQRHQRRERKAARRRRRRENGKSRHRITAPQEAGRAHIGSTNLYQLGQRAAVVAENERRAAKGKRPKALPLLQHVRGRVPRSVLEDIGVLGGRK